MVYVDPKNLGYQPYMDRWIKGRLESEKELLSSLSEKYVHTGINLILEGIRGLQQASPLDMIIPQTSLNMVYSLVLVFYIFSIIFAPFEN